MRRLLLLLTVVWRALSDGAPASVERRLSVSPAFFSFQALPPASSVMPSPLDNRTATECECRASCGSNPACLGYGYSPATDVCLLSDLLPTPQRLEVSADDVWHWYARGGIRRATGRALHLRLDPDVGSRLPGWRLQLPSSAPALRGPLLVDRLVTVGAGRFSALIVSETAAADVDECKTLCASSGTRIACGLFISDTPWLMVMP